MCRQNGPALVNQHRVGKSKRLNAFCNLPDLFL